MVFLDRDGVINVKPREHQYVTSWSEFAFTPGIVETLRALNRFGYRLVVLTNQQCVGKGLLSETALNEIHENMLRVLSSEGVRIEAVFYCPHAEAENCPCRKPKPGLFFRAQSELSFNIDFQSSYFVGDSASDMSAGNRLALKTVFVGSDDSLSDDIEPTYIVSDIAEIVSIIGQDRIKTAG